ncbi:MAG: hypothetical protein ABSE63_16630 [Thermoguttaceae bacterium]|jgi:hypothetical protein
MHPTWWEWLGIIASIMTIVSFVFAPRKWGHALRVTIMRFLVNFIHFLRIRSIVFNKNKIINNEQAFWDFIKGKWRLKWEGRPNTYAIDTEVAEIDDTGIYKTGGHRFKIEMLEYIPDKRTVFLKHFDYNRTPERNELEISDDGRAMSGKGYTPEEINLKYKRI